MFGFRAKTKPSSVLLAAAQTTKSLKSVFGLSLDKYVDVLFKDVKIYDDENKCTWWSRIDAKIKWQKTFLVFYKGCLFAKITVDKIRFDTATVFEYSVLEYFYGLDQFPVMRSESIDKTNHNLQLILEAVEHTRDFDRNQVTWQAKTLKFLKETTMPIRSMQRKYPADAHTADVNKFIDSYGV